MVCSTDSFLHSTHSEVKIVVYSSNGCSKCSILKKWLADKNMQFEEKNLEDSTVMAELILKNAFILSAPALEFGGTVYPENEFFDGGAVSDKKISTILGSY